MAYCGVRTRTNAVLWIITVIFMTAGTIFLPMGAAGVAGCAVCKDKWNDTLTGPKTPGKPIGDISKWCRAAVATYLIYEPDQLGQAGARKEFLKGCLQGGSLGLLIAGAVAWFVAFIMLCIFCCMKPPASASEGVPVMATVVSVDANTPPGTSVTTA